MASYDADLLDRLREALQGQPGLSERAMFGGVAPGVAAKPAGASTARARTARTKGGVFMARDGMLGRGGARSRTDR